MANKYEKVFSDWNKHFQVEWISDGINTDCIDFTEAFGKFIANDGRGVSTNQIRNVFGEVKRIQLKGIEKEKASFLLLKPSLARSAKRFESTKQIKDFKDVILEAHNAVDIENEGAKERFERFCDFFEALLCYHKANGGKS